MGFFDFFKKAEIAPSRKRRFSAAQGGRLNADWIMSTTNINEEIRSQATALVARSEEAAKNNSHVVKWLSMRERNIVGHHGIQLQMHAADASGRTDKAADDLVETHWRKWGRVGTCTADGENSWIEVQRQCARHKGIYGEYFVRIVRNYDNPYRFALQVLNPKQCDPQYCAKQRNGNIVSMGIERDVWGRAVAYHFGDGNAGSAPSVRIPAEDIIHVYHKEFAAQARGIPMMHAALLSLNMFEGYQEAVLVNARVSAAKMGIVEVPQGEDYNPDDYLDDMKINDVEPGKFEVLPEGFKLNKFDPTQPTGQNESFSKVMLRAIANGLGVAYNDFANDLEGVNYSSIRTGMLSERDGWRMEQTEMAEHLCRRVFSAWLEMFLLLPQSGGLPAVKHEKFDGGAHWIPRSFPWIDPLKDAQANKLMIDERWKAPQSVINEQGYDMDDVHSAIKQFDSSLESHGIVPVDETANIKEDEEDEEDKG